MRVSPQWLRLREPADAAARSAELVDHIPAPCSVIHDLGCGTGSMGRWLAPRLTGPQHWILYDRDAELLAAADVPGVTVVTRQRDITRLDPGELAGADLITASALLDIMTADELERLVASCAEAGCPVLITLTVVGRVDLTPADPLDQPIAEAFNDHQRRTVGGRQLLGPDAIAAAREAFTRRGWNVLVRDSPWHLGPAESALTTEWLIGWVDAACEQRPELAGPAASYIKRRLDESPGVAVHHQDLLAIPASRSGRMPAQQGCE